MDKQEINELIKFGKTLKVLYVEDNEDARIQTLKMLDNFFANIVVAVDGEDGLKKFQQDEYHLIITDISMPNKNGIDMLRDIKTEDDDVFCLIISAHNESHYFIDAIELGVDGFLLKPVKVDQFSPIIFKTIKRIQNSQAVKDLDNKQAKLASLGEMMDAIAHQWKQPLSLITIVSSELSMRIDNDMEVTNDDIIACDLTIQEQVDHILTTLDDFRSFFRPNMKQECIFVKQLINSILNLMKITLMKEKIEINLRCDESIKIDVIANEFKHVFINLINNSKDAYLELDNNIQRIINIDVFKDDETNEVIIEFKDNASGIPQNIIDKIFQSNFTTKENGKGTGIGLYMTKQIIEKIGGSIEVYNIKDGAYFKIII
ncbi:MAG: response regulator [Arcobacteraceae bacterium]|nr:response regulator [Arcobacteraceae bacterium]